MFRSPLIFEQCAALNMEHIPKAQTACLLNPSTKDRASATVSCAMVREAKAHSLTLEEHQHLDDQIRT
jgi:hypothetical protein